MNKLIKIPLTAGVVGASLFAASLVIYFFNLDMKAMAAIQPVMEKIYDRVERRPMETPGKGKE